MTKDKQGDTYELKATGMVHCLLSQVSTLLDDHPGDPTITRFYTALLLAEDTNMILELIKRPDSNVALLVPI